MLRTPDLHRESQKVPHSQTPECFYPDHFRQRTNPAQLLLGLEHHSRRRDVPFVYETALLIKAAQEKAET